MKGKLAAGRITRLPVDAHKPTKHKRPGAQRVRTVVRWQTDGDEATLQTGQGVVSDAAATLESP